MKLSVNTSDSDGVILNSSTGKESVEPIHVCEDVVDETRDGFGFANNNGVVDAEKFTNTQDGCIDPINLESDREDYSLDVIEKESIITSAAAHDDAYFSNNEEKDDVPSMEPKSDVVKNAIDTDILVTDSHSVKEAMQPSDDVVLIVTVSNDGHVHDDISNMEEFTTANFSDEKVDLAHSNDYVNTEGSGYEMTLVKSLNGSQENPKETVEDSTIMDISQDSNAAPTDEATREDIIELYPFSGSTVMSDDNEREKELEFSKEGMGMIDPPKSTLEGMIDAFWTISDTITVQQGFEETLNAATNDIYIMLQKPFFKPKNTGTKTSIADDHGEGDFLSKIHQPQDCQLSEDIEVPIDEVDFFKSNMEKPILGSNMKKPNLLMRLYRKN